MTLRPLVLFIPNNYLDKCVEAAAELGYTLGRSGKQYTLSGNQYTAIHDMATPERADLMNKRVEAPSPEAAVLIAMCRAFDKFTENEEEPVTLKGKSLLDYAANYYGFVEVEVPDLA
jgi:hypothetical protein